MRDRQRIAEAEKRDRTLAWVDRPIAPLASCSDEGLVLGSFEIELAVPEDHIRSDQALHALDDLARMAKIKKGPIIGVHGRIGPRIMQPGETFGSRDRPQTAQSGDLATDRIPFA